MSLNNNSNPPKFRRYFSTLRLECDSDGIMWYKDNCDLQFRFNQFETSWYHGRQIFFFVFFGLKCLQTEIWDLGLDWVKIWTIFCILELIFWVFLNWNWSVLIYHVQSFLQWLQTFFCQEISGIFVSASRYSDGKSPVTSHHLSGHSPCKSHLRIWSAPEVKQWLMWMFTGISDWILDF